jgi:hypothetical protein
MKTKITSFLIALLIACLVLSQNAHAVTPSPDGGYPGGNTAEGDNALLSLTSGSYDTALGFRSLEKNTEGNFNTAIGAGALLLNTTANENTATGAGALLSNASPFLSGGNGNTANGAFALFHSSTGSLNTAIGDRALFNNTSGSNNIALGNSAGSAVSTASNVICIGSAGASVSNSCYIGQVFGRGAGPDSVPVRIDSTGKLGTTTSSRRFKKEIKPMDRASEAILALKPVTFHYKSDNTGTAQFGLIAEEVAEVNSDLVVRDEKGEIYTVRYDAVNAMLLNEFLKTYRKLEQQNEKLQSQGRRIKEQEATVTELKSALKALAATVNEQASQLRKVSAQLQINNAAVQMAASNRR